MDDLVKFVGAWTPTSLENLLRARQEVVVDRGRLTDEDKLERGTKRVVPFVPLLPGQVH